MKNFPKDPTRDYSTSNAENEIRDELAIKGYMPETQHRFYKLVTSADFWYPNIRLAIFLDGEQVHKDKEFEDMDKRDFVRSRGCTVRVFSYHAPMSQKRKKEIIAKIIDDYEGLRKMRK